MTKKQNRKIVEHLEPELKIRKSSGRHWIKPNYEDFLNLELWELNEAVFLLHNQQPLEPDYPRDEDGETLSNEKTDKGFSLEINNTYEMALRSIASKAMQLVDDKYVIPYEFVNWAKSKSIDIPAELENIPEPTQSSLELNGKEKRRLGLLEKMQKDFEKAIDAAVKLTGYCIEKNKRFSRVEMEEILEELGFKQLQKKYFEFIRKALPDKYKRGGGRPKKNS